MTLFLQTSRAGIVYLLSCGKRSPSEDFASWLSLARGRTDRGVGTSWGASVISNEGGACGPSCVIVTMEQICKWGALFRAILVRWSGLTASHGIGVEVGPDFFRRAVCVLSFTLPSHFLVLYSVIYLLGLQPKRTKGSTLLHSFDRLSGAKTTMTLAIRHTRYRVF